jgi:hypothetical protein
MPEESATKSGWVMFAELRHVGVGCGPQFGYIPRIVSMSVLLWSRSLSTVGVVAPVIAACLLVVECWVEAWLIVETATCNRQ